MGATRQLQHFRKLVFTCGVIMIALGLPVVASAVVPFGDLGAGLEYRRLQVRFGDLRGEICNRRAQPVDEFAILFVAEDFQQRELWHSVVDVAALGAGQCVGFLRDPVDFSEPFQVRGTLVEFHAQPLLESGNLNLPFQVRGAGVLSRNLNASFCNRSGSELFDASVNLLGLSGHGDVVWRQNFPIEQLDSGGCRELLAELDTGSLTRQILFNVLPVGPPSPPLEGELEPGLSYARLRVLSGRVRGEICNRQGFETGALLIKVYALRENGVEAWTQSLYLPSLAAGECRVFKENLTGQSIRPSAWRFRVARLDAAG